VRDEGGCARWCFFTTTSLVTNNGANYFAVVNSGPPQRWVGNTEHFPINGEIDPEDELWISTESRPQGEATGARVIYRIDGGSTWASIALDDGGVQNGNDHWKKNLGTFPEGTVVAYAVEVFFPGESTWDSNGGEDYYVRVHSLIRDVYTDRARYNPGESVEITVELFNTSGEPVQGELEIRITQLFSELDSTSVPIVLNDGDASSPDASLGLENVDQYATRQITVYTAGGVPQMKLWSRDGDSPVWYDPPAGDRRDDGFEDGDRNGKVAGDTNENLLYDAGEQWTETDPRDPDTDGDNLSDGWEVANGLNPWDNGQVGHVDMNTGEIIAGVENSAHGDPDRDGIPNGEEQQAGTDPWDPGSGLYLVDTQAASGEGLCEVSWSSVPGKRYRVLATATLRLPFVPITDALPADPLNPTTAYLDSLNGAVRKYYLIEVLDE